MKFKGPKLLTILLKDLGFSVFFILFTFEDNWVLEITTKTHSWTKSKPVTLFRSGKNTPRIKQRPRKTVVRKVMCKNRALMRLF